MVLITQTIFQVKHHWKLSLCSKWFPVAFLGPVKDKVFFTFIHSTRSDYVNTSNNKQPWVAKLNIVPFYFFVAISNKKLQFLS